MHPSDLSPMATYRLQIHRQFGLHQAQDLVPYFARLGVSHLYLSPILRARPGSNHGYDVVDPQVINPEAGTEADLGSLVSGMRQFGLSVLLDIVPNHMATSSENPYWRDVLTYGLASPYSGWFDIDWRMPDPDLWGRVLVPVLGRPRALVLEQDELAIDWCEGRFQVRYFDNIFPMDPATVPAVCVPALPRLQEALGPDHPAVVEITSLLERLWHLPKLRERRRRRVHIDRDQAEQWLGQLARQIVQSPRIQQWAHDAAAEFGRGPAGRRRLRSLLERQPYQLVFWRRAPRLLNYRRFFDINELISIRQEDPHVFAATHATLFRWVEQGFVDGFRIDHIDGLRDPLGYLERLKNALPKGGRPRAGFPVFVEKILAPGEPLPPGWPVEGTTGYDFLNQVEAILVAPDGFDAIEDQYRKLLRRETRFEDIAAWGKRRILHHELTGHVNRLARQLLRLAGPNRPSHAAPERSGTRLLRELNDAIVEFVVALPVYRTYLNAATGRYSEADAAWLEQALQGARRARRASPEALDILESVLLGTGEPDAGGSASHERVSFIERLQQLTGPAAAKGIEDTALYAYLPLVSRNEVGGEPSLPCGDPRAALHQANAERAARWPLAMLGVTTHDTKRTADVRARLDVLSEMPDTWWRLVHRWRRINRPLRSPVLSRLVPGPATEYLFYQTVVGIWPAPGPDGPDALPGQLEREELANRIEAYLVKAVREAKRWTSWTRVNQPYEEAVTAFVRKALLPPNAAGTEFLADLQAFVARIARPGFWNSLARNLVQFTSPGTPDLYQGDEIWNFALVDPDNRRPVDFELRQRLLDEIVSATEGGSRVPAFLREAMTRPEDGRIKLHVVHRLLRARQEQPALFGQATYEPLAVEGPLASHLFGFLRTAGSQAALALTARLTSSLVPDPQTPPIGPSVWGEETMIRLPPAVSGYTWDCQLTGERFAAPARGPAAIPASRLLAHLPVAFLTGRQPA